MWILPAELGTVALPEGVLLLPHHYTAEDRERLLALLRVVVPGCLTDHWHAGALDASVGDGLNLVALHGGLVAGVVALAAGDLDTASQRGHQVFDLATRYDIPVLRAFARELLAAVHELRGECDVAARLLFQARSRYTALEDRSRILGVEKRLSRMGITYDPVGTPRRKRSPRPR